MPTEPALFFDLDGTLTDPKPGITGSIQYALRKLDRPVPSQDELTWCIGPPLRGELCGTARRREPRRSRRRALSRAICRCRAVREQRLSRYRAMFWSRSANRDGACSSPPASRMCSPRASSIISGLAAISSMSSARSWTARASTRATFWPMRCEQAGVDPSRALMIGDRSHDVVGAKSNGMDAIGVTYGYGSRDELIGCGRAPSLRLTARGSGADSRRAGERPEHADECLRGR